MNYIIICLVSVIAIVIVVYLVKKQTKLLLKDYKEQLSDFLKNHQKNYNNKIGYLASQEVSILEKKIESLELDLRLKNQEISSLRDKVPVFYSNVEKQINQLKSRLDIFIKSYDTSVVEKFESLSKQERLNLYKKYVTACEFSNSPIQHYEEFIDANNISVTDHGENWKENKFAQRYTTNYTGIYYWIIRM